MTQQQYRALALALAILLPSAALGQTPGVPQRLGIIFVANGSGDNASITDGLGPILQMRRVPLAMHTTRWCPTGFFALDAAAYRTQLDQAAGLAQQIVWHRRTYPNEKIYLMGYSGGTHVALAAARLLPPDTVDDIVLLAAGVSQYHDLRPALRASRCGIASFYSSEDKFAAIISEMVRNNDRIPGYSAGEFGFPVPPPTHPDAALFQRLRQYAWDPTWRAWKHYGGHSGYVRPEFLDGVVLPILLASRPIPLESAP
jgi:pimeloyl-ACP methyl ester carboxylesterase